MVNDFSATLDS